MALEMKGRQIIDTLEIVCGFSASLSEKATYKIVL